jgi:hypothetical protein
MTSKLTSLGPWIRGIQNVNDPAMTPKGCVVEAENVTIDSGGIVSPRAGYDFVAFDGHSLFSHHGRVYGVLNNAICEFMDAGAVTLRSGISGKVTWTVLNDEPVFINNEIIGRITPTDVKLIGVEAPGGFVASGDDIGVKVAVSFVSESGEEGPLSPMVAASSIFLPQPIESTVSHIRIYQTKPNGDVLYEVSEVPVGTMTYDVVDPLNYGRMADTQYMSRMIGGSYARYWRGRLLVARGRTLFFSEPFRYGMYNASEGFVTFEARIDFIEPVEGGVFVALKGLGVRFLFGETPSKWEQKVADIIPAQAGTSLLVPTAQMKLEMQSPPDWVAIWLTNKGFALGLPSGMVIYPQADLLSGLTLGTGSLYFEGDRLIALSQ